MKYGIQMYSIRDLASQDLLAAIRTVAEQGYAAVEFAGFFDRDSKSVKETLKQCNLAVDGAHTPVRSVLDTPEELSDYLNEIGCPYAIVPGADIKTAAAIDSLLEGIERVKPIFDRKGIKLGYHNHTQEMKPNQDGQIAFEEMIRRTDLILELDTYWSYVAGNDPAALIGKYHDRIRLIHLKDGDAAGNGTPLGQGTAPVKEMIALAEKYGMRAIVESESLTPDGPGETGICIAYLKSLPNFER